MPESVAAMPKLSGTLTGPVSPDRCRSCGAEGWPETLATLAPLLRWVEHDEHDGPTGVIVVLCRKCSDRIVGPHPRLYAEMVTNQPHPGAVGICVDCRHRVGVSCPLAKFNGGPGVVLTGPRPASVHLCRSPRRLSGWVKLWRGPVKSCDRREPAGSEVPRV